VTGDGVATALDVLRLVNEINVNGAHELTGAVGSSPFMDPNGDGFITAADVLYVVNYINTHTIGVAGEGEDSRRRPR